MSKTVRDISKWNTNIQYSKMASDSDGVIVRLAYRGNQSGAIVLDKLAKQHIENLQKYDCPVGVYFFTNAITESEAVEEAQFVIDTIKDWNVELSFPIIIDTEYGSNKHDGRADNLTKTVRTDCILAFVKEINNLGYKAAIYASDSWFIDHLEYDRIKDVNKWVAAYNATRTIKYVKDNIIGHQYTNAEVCQGVGTCDTSEWYIDINVSASLLNSNNNTTKKSYNDGDQIILNDTDIYASSTTSKVASTKSGKFYIWSKVKRNGRVRITTKPEYVKEVGKVTGWINI